MGVKTVPVFARVSVKEDAVVHHRADGSVCVTYLEGETEADTKSIGDAVREIAEMYYDGEDPIGRTHVREGVVVRIVNRPKFAAYKHKNWYFKALEGIVKVDAEAPDMEEAQDVDDEEVTNAE
jgi:hypothetical protein